MDRDLSKLSNSHLQALRDLGRDTLRNAEQQVSELTEMLNNIKLEMETRAKRAAE